MPFGQMPAHTPIIKAFVQMPKVLNETVKASECTCSFQLWCAYYPIVTHKSIDFSFNG
jgi:hypothetical protein